MKISVANAKNHLAKLIKQVEEGETVTICRRGKAGDWSTTIWACWRVPARARKGLG